MRISGAPFQLCLLAGTFLVTNQDVLLADASPAVQVSTFDELAAAIEQTQSDQINLTGAGFDLERTLQVTAGKSISVTGTNAVLRCTDACFKVSGTSSVLQLSDIELQLGTGFQSTTHDVSATSFFTVETGGAVETTDVTFSPGVCAGWHFMQGKCISDASTEAVTWNEADTACRAVGANLVSIHTKDENLAMLSRVREGGHSSTWLGASFDPQDQLQWSDQSSSTGYKWPLVSSSSGDCVIMDTTYGGMWARVPCSSTDDLHHYRCAIQVAAAPSIKQVIGDGVGFQHSNPTLFVENPTELVQAHGNTDIISTITTIRYRDVNDNVFNAPVTGTTPYTVQVRVTGTGLTNDMQVTLDTASAAATTASTDGTIATFDLSVSGLPQNLHLKAGTTLASASKVEVVLQSQVVLSHQLDQEVACTTMAPLGTFNPFNANANNEVIIDANQALSLAMTQSGCSVFTLWAPTGQVSPFHLELEGTNLNQLQVSDESEIIDVPVSSDGIVELRYNNVGFVQPTFTISRSSASSSCIKSVAFKYHGEVIGSMSAKSLFDNCAEVCGAVYQQVDECLMFHSTDFLLETVSFDLLTASVCDQLTQGIASNQESLESICTYDGPFTPEILDEVFGASDFSTFKFNSSLPESLELPSNALLAKNRELILDGDNQVANETLPLVVPWFEIEGSATLDYVHLTNGIKVSNGGFLSASLTTLSGVAELTAGGSARWNGGTVNLENVPSFTVGSDSTLYLAGTKIPTPSGVIQSSHIAQVTGSGKVSVTNLYLDNIAVEIANDMSKVEFASAQRSYAYMQCSNDPTAVPFSDLTFVANTNSFEECKSTCENAAQCSGIGLSTDESTGEVRCLHCLAQSCLIACDGPSGYYFEAKSGGGYVSLNGCFATIMNNADPIKSPSLSVSKRDAAVLECQARCEVYSKCASVRVSNTQSPFTCDLYEVDEVNTECGSPQEYHVKFAVSGVDYVPVPYADLKVEPVAARSVGTYTSDECVEYCTIHEACDMVEYSGTTCTLLSHDNTLPAPWSSPSYTPDTEILVPTGDGFPRVFYEVVEQAFKLITDNSDFLEWNGRVAKVQACERKCSAFGYCVAFAFAEPSSLDDDDDNCFLYNAVGARNALAEESTTNPFDLHLAVSSIKFDNVYVPFGTNCSEVEDYVDEVAGVHFENIDAIDSCGSICFMRSTCDMFEYSYQNATCTIYPNTNLTSSFACEHQNAIYDNNMHKFETASPLVTSVRYAKAESGCLEYTLTTTQPASSTSSLEACKVMCDLHPECTGFFYSSGCELIHTLLAKQEDLCVTPNVKEFYLSSHNPERDAYTQIPFDACFVVDRNHEGATIIDADDVSACRKACFEDYNCRAYSFDAARSEGEKCVLHDDATMEPGVDCNAEQAFVETFEKYFVAASSAENVTVVGSEELLTTPNPVSLKECQALCDVFEACVAIAIDSSLSDGSFLDGESDCVLLKASADGAVGTATYSRINNTDLAVMNAYDPYLFTEVVELNIFPDPQKEIELSSTLVVPRQSDCEAMCEVVAGCNSLIYDVSESNFGRCRLYEQGSLTEEDYEEVLPRSSTMRYMVSFAKFVTAKPNFVSFNDNGMLFPDQIPYQVASNVTSGTACERLCLETKEQCEFARYNPDTWQCETYPEGTKMDNNGVMPNICQHFTLRSSGSFELAEVTVFDASGLSLFDPKSVPWSSDNFAVDGVSETTVSSFDLPICTKRPIGELKFKFSQGSSLIGLFGSLPYSQNDSDPAPDEPAKFLGQLSGTVSETQNISFSLNTWIAKQPVLGYSRRSGLCSLESRTLSTLRPMLPVGCGNHCTKMESCVAFTYDQVTATCTFLNSNPSEIEPACLDIITYKSDNFHFDSFIAFPTCDKITTQVRVELDGTWGKSLSLCNVLIWDRFKRKMVDPSAFAHTTASPIGVGQVKGIETMVSNGAPNQKYCFNSGPITDLEVMYWQTTFCTDVPVAGLTITSKQDLTGAKVTVVNDQDIKVHFEPIKSDSGTEITSWDLRLPDIPPEGCTRLEVESKSHQFNFGELRLYDAANNRLIDPNAAASAISDIEYLADSVMPKNLLDGDVYSYFVGTWWSAIVCTAQPVARIVLVKSPGQPSSEGGVVVTAHRHDGTMHLLDTNELFDGPFHDLISSDRLLETRNPFPVEEGDFCTTFLVELTGDRRQELNICEISVEDGNGVRMHDHYASSRTSGSHHAPGSAVSADRTQCYQSGPLKSGDVAWLRTTFCTPRPAALLRIAVKDAKTYNAMVSVIVENERTELGFLEASTKVSQDPSWVFSVPVIHEVTYCDTIRVELEGNSALHSAPNNKNYLHLCEVQVFDSDGVVMFDPFAASGVRASGTDGSFAARKAVDGMLKMPNCYISNEIPHQGTAWWQATFCTPRRIDSVRIVTRDDQEWQWTDRINGAKVIRIDSKGIEAEIGTLQSDLQSVVSLPLSLPTNENLHCGTLRIELDGTAATVLREKKYLQLCEVELLDSNGEVMFDPFAASTATGSDSFLDRLSPSLVVDGRTETDGDSIPGCYLSAYIPNGETGWWEATICTPRVATKVRVTTRSDYDKVYTDRIDGARVLWGSAGFLATVGVIQSSGAPLTHEIDLAANNEYCQNVRMELLGDSSLHTAEDGNNALQLCEVELYDVNGVKMFDPLAANKATASSFWRDYTKANKAADGNISPSSSDCYISDYIPNGQIGWWETTFCTSNPIDKIKVITRNDQQGKWIDRINGAQVIVSFRSLSGKVGELQTVTSGQNEFIVNVSQRERPICQQVRVELEGDNSRHTAPNGLNSLQLSNLEFIDANGNVMRDPYAASRATASGTTGGNNNAPGKALDLDPETAFYSNYIANGKIGWWESTICTPQSIKRVNIKTRTDQNGDWTDRLNGAVVYITSESGVRSRFAELSAGQQFKWDLKLPQEINKYPCETIRVELVGDTSRHTAADDLSRLQLCELQALSSSGAVQVDSYARNRAVAVGVWRDTSTPDNAMDGDSVSDTLISQRCFISSPLSEGEIGWWQSTICTPEPIASVNVITRSDSSFVWTDRINGTVVSVDNKVIGGIQVSPSQTGYSFNMQVGAQDDFVCETIRIELLGDTNRHTATDNLNALQLCEVKVLDEFGVEMFDPAAGIHARANGFYGIQPTANRAVDGDDNPGTRCFHSSYINNGDVGWWQTRFCTPRAIAKIVVVTRNDYNGEWTDRINGAVIYRQRAGDVLRPAYTVQTEYPGQYIWEISSESENSLNVYESKVRIELDGNAASNDDDKKYLQLCEVQVFDNSGLLMFDSLAAGRAEAVSNFGTNFLPSKAVDGTTGSGVAANCFISGLIPDGSTGWWETTFFTPRPVASVRVVTRNDSNGRWTERINGARVELTSHQGEHHTWQQLESVGGTVEWNLQLSNSLVPNEYCVEIEVRLEGSSSSHTAPAPHKSALQLCEVQTYSKTGTLMVDPNAQHQASSSGNYYTHSPAGKAADGNPSPDASNHDCFLGEYLQDGEIGWWKTTYCTPEPVTRVRVITRTDMNRDWTDRINGAQVILHSNSKSQMLGELFVDESSNGYEWDLDVNQPDLECETLRIELLGDKNRHTTTIAGDTGSKESALQLCNIQFFDADNNEMIDPYSASRATANGVWRATSSPENVFNGDDGSCFHSSYITDGDIAWFESTVCTPNPIASLIVTTRNDEWTDRINGAQVSLGSASGDRMVIGELESVNGRYQWHLKKLAPPGCEEIQIELPIETQNSVFSVCEVQLFDENYEEMFDSLAVSRVLANVQGYSTKTVSLGIDGDTSTCFTTPPLIQGGVANWRTTVCTPRRVHSVVVHVASTDMNGAKVKLTKFRDGLVIPQELGFLSGLTPTQLVQQFADIQSCASIRIEFDSLTSVPVCDVKLLNAIGEELVDLSAISRARSHSGTPQLALVGGGNICFNPLASSSRRYWETSFCTSEAIASLEVVTGSSSGTIGPRVFFSDTHQGLPKFLGHLDASQSSTTFHTSNNDDHVEDCETLVIRQQHGVDPLRVCQIRVFDQSGREMFDREAPSRARSDSVLHTNALPFLAMKNHFQDQNQITSSCFASARHSGVRWLSVKMCLPRAIASAQVSLGSGQFWNAIAAKSIVQSEAHVIRSNGEVRILGTSVETVQIANTHHSRFVRTSRSSQPIQLDHETEPVPEFGASTIYLSSQSQTTFKICELEAYEELTTTPLQSLMSFGPPANELAASLVTDSNLDSCFDVKKGFMWIRLATSSTISRVRIGVGSTGGFSGSVSLRNELGVLTKLSPILSADAQYIEFVATNEESGVSKFHVPFDDVDFGELAGVQLQVGGTKKPFELNHQNVESCAALCGEWFKCKGYYLTSSRKCFLRGGLTAGNEIGEQYLHGGRRLQLNDDDRRGLQTTTGPSEPQSSNPTNSPSKSPAVPTSSPTLYPTLSPTTSSPTESPTMYPTLSPTTPRPTAAPTEPIPESARAFERNIKNFAVLSDGTTCLPHFDHTRKAVLYDVSLEACATVCDKTPTCVALGWNVDVCQMFTSQFELHECDERANGLVQLVSLARLVEGSQDGVHMRDIGSMKPADGNTGTTNDASSLEDCEQACKSASSCTMSRWSQSQCTLYDTRSWLRDKDKANEPIVSDTGKGSSTSVKTQTARYETLGGKRLPHSKAILLHTVGDQTYLSCMAICDFLKSCDGFNYDEHSLTCYFLAGLFHNVDAQLVDGTHMHFYRKRYFLRASRFGATKDFARLSQPVMRSECESICDNIGGKAKDAICNAYVHNDAGQCRLSTFEKTNRGILLNNNGYCVAVTLPSLVREQCLELEIVFNAGNGDLGRIRTSDGNCVTRSNDSSGLSEAPCASDETINDMWTWDGSTRFNNFWSAEDGGGDRSQMCQTGVQKAFDADGDPIDGFSCLGGTWGLLTDEHNSLKYENVYVTPEALAAAQTVTNPDVLYFRWLYSSEGKTARSLMAKTKSMQLFVQDIRDKLLYSSTLSDEARQVIARMKAPIDVFERKVGGVGRTANNLATAARVGEYLPYVKYVAKPVRILLSTGAGRIFKGVGKVTKKVNKVDIVLEPVDKLELTALRGVEALDAVSEMIGTLSQVLVQLGFCASQSERQDRIVNVDKKMKQVIASIDAIAEVGEKIEKGTKQAAIVKNEVEGKVINPLRQIAKAFAPVAGFLGAFQFLVVIFTTALCFEIPVIGEQCLPTLKEIGEALEFIFQIIYSIPFIGWVVKLIEDLLNYVLEAIFGNIPLPLPDIGIDTSFVSALTSSLDDAYQSATAQVDFLGDMNNFLPFELDAVEILKTWPLPDLDCNKEICSLENMELPSVDNIASAEVFGHSVNDMISWAKHNKDTVIEAGQLMMNALNATFLDSEIRCVEWGTSMNCGDILRQGGQIGRKLAEELSADDCKLSIPVCKEWEFPQVSNEAREDFLAAADLLQPILHQFSNPTFQPASSTHSSSGFNTFSTSSKAPSPAPTQSPFIVDDVLSQEATWVGVKLAFGRGSAFRFLTEYFPLGSLFDEGARRIQRKLNKGVIDTINKFSAIYGPGLHFRISIFEFGLTVTPPELFFTFTDDLKYSALQIIPLQLNVEAKVDFMQVVHQIRRFSIPVPESLSKFANKMLGEAKKPNFKEVGFRNYVHNDHMSKAYLDWARNSCKLKYLNTLSRKVREIEFFKRWVTTGEEYLTHDNEMFIRYPSVGDDGQITYHARHKLTTGGMKCYQLSKGFDPRLVYENGDDKRDKSARAPCTAIQSYLLFQKYTEASTKLYPNFHNAESRVLETTAAIRRYKQVEKILVEWMYIAVENYQLVVRDLTSVNGDAEVLPSNLWESDDIHGNYATSVQVHVYTKTMNSLKRYKSELEDMENFIVRKCNVINSDLDDAISTVTRFIDYFPRITVTSDALHNAIEPYLTFGVSLIALIDELEVEENHDWELELNRRLADSSGDSTTDQLKKNAYSQETVMLSGLQIKPQFDGDYKFDLTEFVSLTKNILTLAKFLATKESYQVMHLIGKFHLPFGGYVLLSGPQNHKPHSCITVLHGCLDSNVNGPVFCPILPFYNSVPKAVNATGEDCKCSGQCLGNLVCKNEKCTCPTSVAATLKAETGGKCYCDNDCDTSYSDVNGNILHTCGKRVNQKDGKCKFKSSEDLGENSREIGETCQFDKECVNSRCGLTQDFKVCHGTSDECQHESNHVAPTYKRCFIESCEEHTDCIDYGPGMVCKEQLPLAGKVCVPPTTCTIASGTLDDACNCDENCEGTRACKPHYSCDGTTKSPTTSVPTGSPTTSFPTSSPTVPCPDDLQKVLPYKCTHPTKLPRSNQPNNLVVLGGVSVVAFLVFLAVAAIVQKRRSSQKGLYDERAKRYLVTAKSGAMNPAFNEGEDSGGNV